MIATPMFEGSTITEPVGNRALGDRGFARLGRPTNG